MKRNLTPGNTSPVNNQKAQVIANVADTQTAKPVINFKKIGVSLVLALGSYWLFWWALSSHGVSPFLSHFIGCMLALILLAYVDSVVESKIEMSRPVLILMMLLLIFNLSINYLPGFGKTVDKKPTMVVNSETGSLRYVNDIWFTDAVFKPGTKVKIEVLYHEAKMTNGQLLFPGVYEKTLTGNGCVMFEGVTDKPSQIKVTY